MVMGQQFRLLAALTLISWALAACSHAPPKQPDAVSDPAHYITDLMQKTRRQKVVVFCMQSDIATNQRLEDYMAHYLNQQGFRAVGTRDAFKPRAVYTPLELLSEMNAQGIKGVIEVSFSGKPNAEGMPEHFTLLYRKLKIKRKNVVDNRYSTVLGAFVQLMLVMPLLKS